MKISLSAIKVNNDRRSADNAKIKELAESMEQVGLLHPVTVTSDHTLIAGAQRLEAAKLLGWAEIEVKVMEFDSRTAELAMLDENLMRLELHYIERGEQLARRKLIYEELHPETKARNKQGHVNNYKSSTADSALEEIPSFVKSTADKTGISSRVISEEIQIANNLTPAAKEAVIASDIPKKDALKLARMEQEKQDAVVAKIANGNAKNVAEALESTVTPINTTNTAKPHIHTT
jgi:hypothetical protein